MDTANLTLEKKLELLQQQINELITQDSQQRQQLDNSSEISQNENDDKDKKIIYGDKWVVMQNRLLHAISHLTLNERRLILVLSPIIREQISKDPNQQVFILKVRDYVNTYQLKHKNYYAELEKTAASIQQKLIEFWNFNENHKVNSKIRLSWVTKGEYIENKGQIYLEFHKDVIEMLTLFDKANPFTKYQKDWITKLGVYGIVLLELILSCMYQSHKNKSFKVSYLREKFDCVETYPSFFDFKKKVIDKAISEIQNNTPIRITYVQKKEGRTITDLVFSFEDISQKLDTIDPSNQKLMENNSLFDVAKISFSQQQQEEYLKKYQDEPELIRYCLETANQYIISQEKIGNPIRNVAGVYITALNDNWGEDLYQQELAKKHKQKEEETARQIKQQKASEQLEQERAKEEQNQREFEICEAKFLTLSEAEKEIVLDKMFATMGFVIPSLRKGRANGEPVYKDVMARYSFKVVMKSLYDV